MLRRFWLIVLVVILTACGSDSPDETPNADITLTPTPLTLPVTTLTIGYHDTGIGSGLETLATSFQDAFPSVTVILTQSDNQSFQTEFQEGGGPDLILGTANDYKTLRNANAIVSLDINLLDQSTLLIPSQTYQALLVDRIPYAFPLLTEIPVVYVNTSLVETEVSTFADFLTLAGDFPTQIQSNFAGTSGWLEIDNFIRPLAPREGLDIQAATFTAYLQRLSQLSALETVQFVGELNVTDETGLAVGSSWRVAQIHQTWGDNMKVLPLTVGDVENSYQLGNALVMMISLNATSENYQAAHEFIKWSVQPLQQDAFSGATGLAPLWNTLTPDPILQNAAAISDQALYVHFENTYYAEILPRYDTAIAQVLSGVLTPEEAAATLFSVEN